MQWQCRIHDGTAVCSCYMLCHTSYAYGYIIHIDYADLFRAWRFFIMTMPSHRHITIHIVVRLTELRYTFLWKSWCPVCPVSGQMLAVVALFVPELWPGHHWLAQSRLTGLSSCSDCTVVTIILCQHRQQGRTRPGHQGPGSSPDRAQPSSATNSLLSPQCSVSGPDSASGDSEWLRSLRAKLVVILKQLKAVNFMDIKYSEILLYTQTIDLNCSLLKAM